MTQRQNYHSGGPWETKAGYSRAVRVGDHIHIAGTVAVDADGNATSPGDSYHQSLAIFDKFAEALSGLGAELGDVVRTRAFITDVNLADGFLRAHGETFRHIMPAATLVAVSGLLGEGTVIEIEADAIVDRPVH